MLMDNHYPIHEIHQDVQGQFLTYIQLNYFHELNLHQIYQSVFDLTNQITERKILTRFPTI